MRAIQQSASVALASELANSLLVNGLKTLYDARFSSMSYLDFEDTFGDSENPNRIRTILKRLSDFAKTLKGLRITEIKPLPISDDCQNSTMRVIQFHYGTDKNHSLVVVDITLTLEEDLDAEMQVGAGEGPHFCWRLHFWKAILCKEHQDKKFKNMVLLGFSAFE